MQLHRVPAEYEQVMRLRGSADSIDPDALAIGSNIKVGGLLHAVRDRLGPGSRFVTFAGSLGQLPTADELAWAVELLLGHDYERHR